MRVDDRPSGRNTNLPGLIDTRERSVCCAVRAAGRGSCWYAPRAQHIGPRWAGGGSGQGGRSFAHHQVTPPGTDRPRRPQKRCALARGSGRSHGQFPAARDRRQLTRPPRRDCVPWPGTARSARPIQASTALADLAFGQSQVRPPSAAAMRPCHSSPPGRRAMSASFQARARANTTVREHATGTSVLPPYRPARSPGSKRIAQQAARTPARA